MPENQNPDSVTFTVKKVFEDDSANEVEARPTFINNVAFHRVGASIFMDVGIIPVDDILNARKLDNQVRFVVLERIVMGPEGFQTLLNNANELFSKLKAQGLFTDASEEGKADAEGEGHAK